MSNVSNVKRKDKAREENEKLIEQFLKDGGTIKVLEREEECDIEKHYKPVKSYDGLR